MLVAVLYKGYNYECLIPLSAIFQLFHAWQSVLSVDDTRMSEDSNRPQMQVTDFYHISLDRVYLPMWDFIRITTQEDVFSIYRQNLNYAKRV